MNKNFTLIVRYAYELALAEWRGVVEGTHRKIMDREHKKAKKLGFE